LLLARAPRPPAWLCAAAAPPPPRSGRLDGLSLATAPILYAARIQW
jgi:hypothetical protein